MFCCVVFIQLCPSVVLGKLTESQTSRDNESCMSYMSKQSYSSKVGCGKKNLVQSSSLLIYAFIQQEFTLGQEI